MPIERAQTPEGTGASSDGVPVHAVAHPTEASSETVGWLNRTVLAVGLASFFSDVGHEMATTAMPALIAVLGGNAGTLGIIEGMADGASSFAKLISGSTLDRFTRRKPLAVVGYFMTAAGMASFALATSTWHVFFGRLAGWLGRGARTPVRNVLLTEATTKATYGRAFGLERAMDSAGAIVGPIASAVLVALVGARSMFALTLVPGLIAALLIAFGVTERRPSHPSAIRGPYGSFTAAFRADLAALPPGFRRFLTGVGIAGLGDFSNTLLILFATQAWTPGFGRPRAAALAMGFYVGYNAVYTIACMFAGRLADRFPKHRVLSAGYALATVPALALMLWPGASFAKFALVFGASGLYMGFWETVESTTAAEYLPAQVRGTGFGLLATVNGIGDLLSSVCVGALWAVAPSDAMGLVVMTSVIGAVVILSTGPQAGQ